MHTNHRARISELEQQLEHLLKASQLKYSEWPSSNTAALRTQAGIYHFFESSELKTTSLYIGKAGFGGGNWSLYKRLSQHFQISQQNTILGKASKASGLTPMEMKASLCERGVYLQWLVINSEGNEHSTQVEADLIRIECFCNAILMPKFTDA